MNNMLFFHSITTLSSVIVRNRPVSVFAGESNEYRSECAVAPYNDWFEVDMMQVELFTKRKALKMNIEQQ